MIAILAVVGLGLVRLLAGIANGESAGLLVVLIIGALVVALVQLGRAPRRTRLGDRTLREPAEHHNTSSPALRPGRTSYGPAAVALGVGIWGVGALWASDRARLHGAGIGRRPEIAGVVANLPRLGFLRGHRRVPRSRSSASRGGGAAGAPTSSGSLAPCTPQAGAGGSDCSRCPTTARSSAGTRSDEPTPSEPPHRPDTSTPAAPDRPPDHHPIVQRTPLLPSSRMPRPDRSVIYATPGLVRRRRPACINSPVTTRRSTGLRSAPRGGRPCRA